MEKTKASVNKVDIQVAIAIGICIITALFVPQLQQMTACIAVLLCLQDSVKVSWKAGVTRLIITLIGGVTFILVVLTKPGMERVTYAIFRLVSTMYGVLAVLLVACIFSLIFREKEVADMK